jgi:hypothetical protein
MIKKISFLLLCLFSIGMRSQSTLDTVAIFSPDTSNHNFNYCTNTAYHFTGHASQGNILGYQWECYPATNVVFNPANPPFGQNGIDITFTTPGTYSLVIIVSSQHNGIDSSVNFTNLAFNTYTVQVNQTPTITVTPPNPTVCLGWTGTTLCAHGATTYTWTQAPSQVPPTSLNPPFGDSVNVNPSGIPSPFVTYSVTGTGSNACNSLPISITVTVQPRPAPIYPLNDTICEGTSAYLAVKGMPSNTIYYWGASFIGNNTDSSIIQTPIHHGQTDTTFTDTIRIAVSGCPSYPYHIVKVVVKPNPTVSYVLQADSTPHV